MEKQDKLIQWSVGKGRNRRKLNRKKQKEVMTDMSNRVATKQKKKREKDTRRVERRLCSVDVDKLAEEFPDLDSQTMTDLSDILTGRAVGRSICHVWYDDDDTRSKTVYSGQIDKLKGKKSDKYVVSYWDEKETPDDGVA